MNARLATGTDPMTTIAPRNLAKSNAQFQKAVKRLPLGVSSTFRYWGDDRTIYVDHGKGGRTWISTAMPMSTIAWAMGPRSWAMLMTASMPPPVVAWRLAASSPCRPNVNCRRRPQRQDGASGGTRALLELWNRGGDGRPASGPRLSGRESYLLVEGGYHGLFDAAMWMSNMEEWDLGSNQDPELALYGKGIPNTVKKLAHITPMNNFDRLEDMFRKHGDKFAAMLIEPIQGNCCSIMAQPEYVKLARELCTRYGVMLIIDEVKSGFRVGKSGIQGIMGVTPDITTFAKAVATATPFR